jgi:hypothetical protein
MPYEVVPARAFVTDFHHAWNVITHNPILAYPALFHRHRPARQLP